MADLSFAERMKLEKLFDMGGGYVLGFSNRTFQEFVFDAFGKNIYDAKYSANGSSKAKQLRAFWKEEPNHIVGTLTTKLLEYMGTPSSPELRDLHQECSGIASRLLSGAPVSGLESLDPPTDEAVFQTLIKSVQHSIDTNEPATGLDRLHTYVVKFIRAICRRRGIQVREENPLHSLMGEYAKKLKADGLLESEMTERIIKTTISTLEAFNHVRNRQSLAHDNEVLGHAESVLILAHVVALVNFIQGIERQTHT
jgi:hypothetical protein